MKGLFNKIACVVLAVVSLFTMVGCVDQSDSVETVECAPCTVSEIYRWNEKVFDVMWYLRQSAAMNSTPKVTVNGEVLSKMDFVLGDDLAEGEYDIVFSTPDGFTIREIKIVDGVQTRVEKPYNRSVKLKVKVSSQYPDIFDEEYRSKNGLWTNPMNEEWYQKLVDKYNK